MNKKEFDKKYNESLLEVRKIIEKIKNTSEHLVLDTGDEFTWDNLQNEFKVITKKGNNYSLTCMNEYDAQLVITGLLASGHKYKIESK